MKRSISDLPESCCDKTGWPWTGASPNISATMPDGSQWPKVSIVTPSYNQGRFLEETIRSILLQGYPNLEYIVMDGGSTDQSTAIIKKYEPWLTYWESEADQGQAHAINRGFQHATGEIFAWLNSDDMLLPQTIFLAVSFLCIHAEIGMVFGDRLVINENSKPTGERRLMSFVAWQLRYCCGVNQESAFFRKNLFNACGGLDQSLHFALDYDLWWRMLSKAPFAHLPVTMAAYRKHHESKSVLVNRNDQSERTRSMAVETARIRKDHMGRDTSRIESVLLPRLRTLMWLYERLSGRYAARRKFVESLRKGLWKGRLDSPF